MPQPVVEELGHAMGTETVSSSERDIRQREHNQAIIAMLKSWEDDDPEEQRETWSLLEQALPHLRVNINTRVTDS